jgi:PIN domain nuclease of toxin-antitoxin system
MKSLLLDTHIWFWYLIGSEKLPVKIHDLIKNSKEPPRVSPISAWELSMLAEKKKIQIDAEFRSWIGLALKKFPIQEASLNLEVALKSREIALSHKDPADRFLAATALVYDLTFVTVDQRMIGLAWLPAYSG